jgi:MoaA/NifB/PqqE/SkfB family radical SAM enzyme
MDSIKVFAGPNSQTALFENFVRQKGYQYFKTTDCLTYEHRMLWDSKASDQSMGIWTDYLFESEKDLKTFEEFVSQVKSGGSVYYTPRPNEHLLLSRAFLAGEFPMKRFFKEPSFFEKFFAKKSKISFAEEVRKKNEATVAAGKVPVELPNNLQLWPNEWRSWIPDQETIRHDLIERGAHFFPYPKGIHVVILNKCNLKCIMCPYHSPEYTAAHTNDYLKNKKEMEFETFKKIADYAGQNGIALQFGQIEETLVHPRFFEFLEYAKEVKVPHVHVTTNGTLLSKSKAEQLANSGVTSVMFSVDASDSETYKSIRGASLDVLERNIMYFLSLIKGKNIRTMVSFILQPLSKNQKDAFLEKWRKLGIDQVTFYVLSKFDPKTGETIREVGAETYDKGKRYPCASPWVQSVVFPEGEVSLCCKTLTDVGWRGVVSVGTLKDSSFAEVWNGNRYKSVRNELLNNSFKEFDVCRKCQIWSASTSLSEDHPHYKRQYNETSETITFKVVKTEVFDLQM